jgi:hypothetical protein
MVPETHFKITVREPPIDLNRGLPGLEDRHCGVARSEIIERGTAVQTGRA